MIHRKLIITMIATSLSFPATRGSRGRRIKLGAPSRPSDRRRVVGALMDSGVSGIADAFTAGTVMLGLGAAVAAFFIGTGCLAMLPGVARNCG